MTRVGLNALYLEPGRVGGTETYARCLVRALGDAAPGSEFVLYLSREAGATEWDVPANVRIDVAPGRSVSRVQRLGWELTGLVGRAARDRVAILHSLGTTSPLASPMPRVVTVHDLIYEHHPGAFPRSRLMMLRALVPRMVRRADAVIADSEATRRDVVAFYRVDPARAHVVHLGPGRSPIALDAREAERLRAAAGVAGRYVLSVATTQPHKNLEGLVRAFRAVREAEPAVMLVLVGARGQSDDALGRAVAASGLDEAIVMAGRLDDASLDAVYAGAEVFVYPSLCEGFGLPLLEAMQRGVPVVSSRAASLPEVGGDAVAYVDSRDEAALAAAVVALLRDPGARARLVEAGRARARRFTWDRSAREVLAVYDAVLGRSPSRPAAASR